jgi:hypothetical protein
MPIAGKQVSTATLDHSECPEAVIFQLENPVGMVERSGPIQERHWLVRRLHKESIGLLCCGIRIRFDHDIYLRAWFETGLLAILVSNHIVDANLPVQIVGSLNTDLCLLW